MIGSSLRKLAAILAVALTVAVLVPTADARVGGGMSQGSRGSRTFTAPPPTSTAPTVAPMQRSITQPPRPGLATSPASSGFFGRGLLGGLAAGFLGAGLFGLLFGHGLFGGLGGFASIFGLILQVGLVVLIGRFLWNMWQRRQPAFAGGPALRDMGGGGASGMASSGMGFGMGGGMGSGGAPGGKVDITPADYDAFEQLLGEIYSAFNNEDINGLRACMTPEMLSYFSEELSQNASRGVVNKVSGVKLLQGDLSEAWSENGLEYASVAMRFALVDQMVDRSNGRPVSGSTTPQEVTEVWTFMRATGGSWLLTAIQQS